MLNLNAMSSQSKKIDEMLTELKIDGIKCVSFKHATSEEILVAMHCDDIKTLKARHETLFNVRKIQLIKTNDENISVEQAMQNVKENGANLFLGIENVLGNMLMMFKLLSILCGREKR